MFAGRDNDDFFECVLNLPLKFLLKRAKRGWAKSMQTSPKILCMVVDLPNDKVEEEGCKCPPSASYVIFRNYVICPKSLCYRYFNLQK